MVNSLLQSLLKREKKPSRKITREIDAILEVKTATKCDINLSYQMPQPTRSTFLIAFSPDRTKVATSHGNHSINISDCYTCKVVQTLSGHNRTPWCVSFHPVHNNVLASGCLGGDVRLWNLNMMQKNSSIYQSQSVIASLTFHPTKDIIVICSSNKLIFFNWNLQQVLRTMEAKPHNETIRLVRFLPNSDKLLTGIVNSSNQYCKPQSLNVSRRGDPESGGGLVETVSCMKMQKREDETLENNGNNNADDTEPPSKKPKTAVDNCVPSTSRNNNDETNTPENNSKRSACSLNSIYSSDNESDPTLLSPKIEGGNSTKLERAPLSLERQMITTIGSFGCDQQHFNSEYETGSNLCNCRTNNGDCKKNNKNDPSKCPKCNKIDSYNYDKNDGRNDGSSDRKECGKRSPNKSSEHSESSSNTKDKQFEESSNLSDTIVTHNNEDRMCKTKDSVGNNAENEMKRLSRGKQIVRKNRHPKKTLLLENQSKTQPPTKKERHFRMDAKPTIQEGECSYSLSTGEEKRNMSCTQNNQIQVRETTKTSNDTNTENTYGPKTEMKGLEKLHRRNNNREDYIECVNENQSKLKETEDVCVNVCSHAHNNSTNSTREMKIKTDSVATQTDYAAHETRPEIDEETDISSLGTSAYQENPPPEQEHPDSRLTRKHAASDNGNESSPKRQKYSVKPNSHPEPETNTGSVRSHNSSQTDKEGTAHEGEEPSVLQTKTVRSEIWNFTLSDPNGTTSEIEEDLGIESTSSCIPVHGYVSLPATSRHSASISNLSNVQARTAIATATARSSHHVHTAVVIASEDDGQSKVALRTAVNRAIAGAFAGSGEAAVANNIIDTTHRLQVWDLAKDDTYPNIEEREANIVVPFCKIHNDSSIDVSPDGTLIAVYVPSEQGFPMDARLKVISLRPENYLQCIYSRKYGPNAVAVSFSPLAHYLSVGLASHNLRWQMTPKQLVAQILKLPDKGKLVENDTTKPIFNILHKCNSQQRSNVSLNTIRFHPTSGMGILYGTNRGHIQHCHIGNDLELNETDMFFKKDSKE